MSAALKYNQVANNTVANQTTALLRQLVASLQLQRDTSVKKVDRVVELRRALEICTVFVESMNDDIAEQERAIYLSIFVGISSKIVAALRGDPVKFDDAIGAIKFILESLQEK